MPQGLPELRDWIESLTGTPVPREIVAFLKDGQVLCRLANSIDPGAVKKVNSWKTPFHSMENIQNFLRWCRKIGVKESCLFHIADLDSKGGAKEVIRTLLALHKKYSRMYSFRDKETDYLMSSRDTIKVQPQKNKLRAFLADFHAHDQSLEDPLRDGRQDGLDNSKLTAAFNEGINSPIEEYNHEAKPKSKLEFQLESPHQARNNQWESQTSLGSPKQWESHTNLGSPNQARYNQWKKQTNLVPHNQTRNNHWEKQTNLGSPNQARNIQWGMQTNLGPPNQTNKNQWENQTNLGSPHQANHQWQIQANHQWQIQTNHQCKIRGSHQWENEARNKKREILQQKIYNQRDNQSSLGSPNQRREFGEFEEVVKKNDNNEGRSSKWSPTNLKMNAAIHQNNVAITQVNENDCSQGKDSEDDSMDSTSSSPTKGSAILSPVRSCPKDLSLSPISQTCRSKKPVGRVRRRLVGNVKGISVEMKERLENVLRSKKFHRISNRSLFEKSLILIRGTYKTFQKLNQDQGKADQNLIAYLECVRSRTERLSKSKEEPLVDPLLKMVPGMKCYVPDNEEMWLKSTIVKYIKREKILLVDVELSDGTVERREINLEDSQITGPLNNATPDGSCFLPPPNVLDEESVEAKEDMWLIKDLSEPCLLYNLKQRFLNIEPYTYCGEICIAVNPYQWIDHLYNKGLHHIYLKYSKRDLPPHVYGVSASAYKNMLTHTEDQSIIVTGESGSGKTETTKIMMNHIRSLAGNRESDSTLSRVVEVNHVLESFGNARTSRNDNSSRFGKFTQLQFDVNGTLVGAICETYLLEKSRVVSFTSGERNYHIFYQLLAGLDHHKLQSFFLNRSGTYSYLGRIEDMKLKDIDDKVYFNRTKQALAMIGLSSEDETILFQAAATIIHLGELLFLSKKNGDEPYLAKNAQLSIVTNLLGTSETMVEKILTTRTVSARGESYSICLSIKEAKQCRDALAKSIYSKLFTYLVSLLNSSISGTLENVSKRIGVLDIFGFETFQTNGFEQFCINYANEKLQEKFNYDVFQSMGEEYESEGLLWESPTFRERGAIVNMIEGKLGILALLNDYSRQPSQRTEAFVQILENVLQHERGKYVSFSKTKKTEFTIHHYAGNVTYQIETFIERHRDPLLPDLLDLMNQSNSIFLQKLFADEVANNIIFTSNEYQTQSIQQQALWQQEQTQHLQSIKIKKDNPSIPHTPRNDLSSDNVFTSTEQMKTLPFRGNSSLTATTLGSQFKNSLNQLMKNLSKTKIHYIRCIRPNSIQSHTFFDNTLVVEQLRCARLIEAIQYSRKAYPCKLSISEFKENFQVLFPLRLRRYINLAEACNDFLKFIGRQSPTEYQIGRGSIYFKQGILEDIENVKNNLLQQKAILLQATWKARRQRNWYTKAVRAVIKIQQHIRGYIDYREYHVTRIAVVIVQLAYRRWKQQQRNSKLSSNNLHSPLQGIHQSTITDTVRHPTNRDYNHQYGTNDFVHHPTTKISVHRHTAIDAHRLPTIDTVCSLYPKNSQSNVDKNSNFIREKTQVNQNQKSTKNYSIGSRNHYNNYNNIDFSGNNENQSEINKGEINNEFHSETNNELQSKIKNEFHSRIDNKYNNGSNNQSSNSIIDQFGMAIVHTLVKENQHLHCELSKLKKRITKIEENPIFQTICKENCIV